MGTFSSRFSNHDDDGHNERPECYGDPDYYDITDDTCKNCRWKGTCRLKISALERDRRPASSSSSVTTTTTSAIPQRSAVKGKIYEDAGEEDTFTSVLAHNASLNAITAMSETLTDALSQIPRKKYPGLRKRSTT
jgi:hypothetical protein